MKQWIARLFRRHEPELPCVKRIARCNIEVAVFTYPLNDGTASYLVEVYWLDPAGGEPALIAWFDEQDFGKALSLLIDAERFIDAERLKFPRLTCTED